MRLIAVFFAFAASLLGGLGAVEVASAHVIATTTCNYDISHYDEPATNTAASDRPPFMGARLSVPTGQASGELGDSARSAAFTTRAVTIYDQPTSLVHRAERAVAIMDHGQATARSPSSFQSTGVAAKTTAKACSFSGTTVVLMADGTRKPIEDVEVGDKVIATDPETGEQEAKTVEHVWVHDDTVNDLVVDGEVIATTEDHPFWSVTDQRFERADELADGEKVLGADGEVITVSGLRVGTGRQALAYNLTVEGIHTYHVGPNEILVHNTCASWGLDALSQSGARASKGGLTQAGRKFSQHGGQGAFPTAKGSMADLNRLGQHQLDDILTTPGTVTRGISGGNFAGGRYFIAPDGRGAAFDADGAFQYFGAFKP